MTRVANVTIVDCLSMSLAYAQHTSYFQTTLKVLHVLIGWGKNFRVSGEHGQYGLLVSSIHGLNPSKLLFPLNQPAKDNVVWNLKLGP